MFRNLFLTGMGLVVAAGVPFVYYNAGDWLKSASASAAALVPATGAAAGDQAAAAAGAAPGAPPADRIPILAMSDALRFDITPDGILRYWPRVSTGLGQIQLHGYRVPLITGTAEDDVAGSATYYFNPQQQLQRITFYGTTGNPQRLLAVLAGRYNFARKVLNSPSMYVYEVADPSGLPPQSTCRIEQADVVKAAEPYTRYKISLTIERPTG